MSQSLTLARPYARAAFAASSNDGRAASWSQALAFAAQVAADPRVQALLSHPQLEQLRAEAEQIVKARVTAASELPAAELESIRAALKRRFGREVEIETAIDPSLIGGAVIDAGDVVIDGSLKGKLERLQGALAH